MDQPLRDQGWFIATDDARHGPISAAQAWNLLVDARVAPSAYVWHPSLPAWKALPRGAASTGASPPEAPSPAAPPLQLREFRLSNARTITWLACASAPLFIVGAALARDVQDPAFTLATIALVGFLAWWLYLEQKGVRLRDGELSFPARVPLWPYPPTRSHQVRLAEASGFECWSRSASSQWFLVHANAKRNRILLDEPLHREILMLALERGIPAAGAS